MSPQTGHKKLKTVYRQLHLSMKWMWPTTAEKKNIVQQQHGGNKGFCQNPLLSHQCVCEILSVLLCACQATLASIWITLMRGERGNNQRSQYFTLDTDAYLYAAGRRDLLAAQLSSDLTLRFNATFLSPTHSSRFLSHSLSALPPPTCLCPLSPLAWLQLKGKCSSGEVRYLHHKVLGPIMLPGAPNILLLPLPFLIVFAFPSRNVYFFLSTSLTSSGDWRNEPLRANNFSTKHGSVVYT